MTEAADWLRQQLKFDPVKRLMQLMNERHAVINMNGKTVILTEEEKEITFGSVADLNQYYANVRIQQGNKDYSVAQVWMRYGSRRTYTRITFAPQGADSRSYNLWRGPSVEADPTGSCRLFLEHLLHIICNGNKEYLDWLIKWLAHTVQKPEEKPGTAVVLQGVKGCGKDTVGEYFGGIFQHHHTKLSSPEQLHGRFNGHQAQTLFLHVEEGFWAGDKAAEGKLKHLITSPVMLLEKKGVDAFPIDSFLRVFISSNEDWAVPVSANGERRFFVLRCSDAVARNKAYFDALYHEMENGGRGALLGLPAGRGSYRLQRSHAAGYRRPGQAGHRKPEEHRSVVVRGSVCWPDPSIRPFRRELCRLVKRKDQDGLRRRVQSLCRLDEGTPLSTARLLPRQSSARSSRRLRRWSVSGRGRGTDTSTVANTSIRFPRSKSAASILTGGWVIRLTGLGINGRLRS